MNKKKKTKYNDLDVISWVVTGLIKSIKENSSAHVAIKNSESKQLIEKDIKNNWVLTESGQKLQNYYKQFIKAATFKIENANKITLIKRSNYKYDVIADEIHIGSLWYDFIHKVWRNNKIDETELTVKGNASSTHEAVYQLLKRMKIS